MVSRAGAKSRRENVIRHVAGIIDVADDPVSPEGVVNRLAVVASSITRSQSGRSKV